MIQKILRVDHPNLIQQIKWLTDHGGIWTKNYDGVWTSDRPDIIVNFLQEEDYSAFKLIFEL